MHGPWAAANPRPDSGPGVACWLDEHKAGLLCWDMLEGDNTLRIVPPVHMLNWRPDLSSLDNCDFSTARAALAERSTAVGALSIAPLPIEGATGQQRQPDAVALSARSALREPDEQQVEQAACWLSGVVLESEGEGEAAECQ